MMETTDSSLKNVIRAYETYDEDKRLEADNVRRLEFMTTLVYMNKYLKEGEEENAENSALAAYDMETGEETMHYNLWARYLSLAPVREDLIIAVPSALGGGDGITAIRPR